MSEHRIVFSVGFKLQLQLLSVTAAISYSCCQLQLLSVTAAVSCSRHCCQLSFAVVICSCHLQWSDTGTRV